LATYQQELLRLSGDRPRRCRPLETGGATAASEICYRRPEGVYLPAAAPPGSITCFANDFYVEAMALADRQDRVGALTRAAQHVAEARKYRRPEGGEGFDQCMHTTTLAEKIAEALDPSRGQNPTGGIQSQAR